MQAFPVVLAAVTLGAWLLFVVDLVRGRDGLVFLDRVEPRGDRQLPPVSVVVAARNEEAGVEAGLRSLLALEYPELEIIAVDDRSDDRTGEIVAAIAADEPRLRWLRVEELPAGWLGKNHALHVGAEAASGELLLFTDADVVFEATLLARAVSHLEAADLDHLAIAADVEAPGPGLALFVATFGLLFNAYFRPWRAVDPASDTYVGFGAFNLVRAEAYRRAGGHRAIAADPLDDVHLGRELKRSGARQQCALAGAMLRVEWYPSLRAAIRGLEKNALAAVGWSVPRLLLGSVAQLLLVVWPFLAPLLVDGAARWLNLATAVLIVAVQTALLGATSLPAWTALALPAGILLVQYTWVRAAILTLWRGGIEWRGTFYSLDELR